MTSNNTYPFPGDRLSDDSPIMQRAFAFGNAAADLVREGERAGEARVHSRLTPRIDNQVSVIKTLESRLQASEKKNADLSKSLKAWQGRAAKAQARTNKAEADAAKAKADADDRVAQVRARIQEQLAGFSRLFEQTDDNAASSGAHAGNQNGRSAAVNSSAATEQQSNQPEQQISPSSSDTSANARIKTEEIPLMIQLRECPSSNDSDSSDYASTSERSGLLVDEIDMLEQEERYKRLREVKEEDEVMSESRDNSVKRQRTE
ncbi:hypothetical protein FMUND_9357 [Fusarium mundagurra]|uniref:Uncharacterized protein n=1 Tax=Fusarium mundagurra TaxID=1567541 RepID=A0A8H6DAY0_9HYPO|nr:hypothetical protein FMUND_9357 [Fusarium mundagurra]